MTLRSTARRWIRLGALAAGRRLAASENARTVRLRGFFEVGQWVGDLANEPPIEYTSRDALLEAAAELVDADRPLYLEFGVFMGESLSWWSERLKQPGARLVGFDSFEGLPEDWTVHMPRGAFAVDEVPHFADERVSLEVGWFDDTVPRFQLPDHNMLIVNIDCDLYSSTALVLDHITSALVPGSLIYFDELHDGEHELRAVKEWTTRTAKQLRPIGFTEDGTKWLFRVKA